MSDDILQLKVRVAGLELLVGELRSQKLAIADALRGLPSDLQEGDLGWTTEYSILMQFMAEREELAEENERLRAKAGRGALERVREYHAAGDAAQKGSKDDRV